MKKGYVHSFKAWVALGCLAGTVVATGCGKKDKKSDDSPGETAVETSVESSTDGGVARIRYRSNIKDAKFKCKTEVNGQTAEWADCPADGTSLQLQPGAKYVVLVKATSADGKREDAEPSKLEFAGAAGPAQPGTGGLVTEILNKEEIGSIVTATSLKLAFGVKGGAVEASDLRYECRRELETAFRRCPEGASYTFADLVDGGTYELAVRAVVRSTNATAGEDLLTFRVQLPKIEVQGADKLAEAEAKVRRGEQAAPVSLALSASSLPGNAKLLCKFDDAAETDCPNPLELNLSQIPRGSHTITITAKDGQNTVLSSRALNFCVGICQATAGGTPTPPPVADMQIGSFYRYTIPSGMHVTQYATTKGYNQSLRFYRVMAESDPNYIGNYGCWQSFDRKLSATAPGGNVYDYCLSTPPRDYYKAWLADFRLANNHLELATDHNVVAENPSAHERIMINVFDTDYEFMYGRSRFEELCMNKRGEIRKTMKPIRFINADFWGEAVRAEFWMCVTELAGTGPGLPGANDEWWVGAFFITSDGLDLPLHECVAQKTWCDENGVYHTYNPTFCGQYKNPSLLEVVYMTKKPFFEPHDFAQYAQSRFVRNLQEIVPVQ